MKKETTYGKPISDKFWRFLCWIAGTLKRFGYKESNNKAFFKVKKKWIN